MATLNSSHPKSKPPSPAPQPITIEPNASLLPAEENEHEDDDDEFLPAGWDAASSAASTSISPSIYQHAFENGRRYHAYKHGRYPIPNDDLEQSREDMKHAMLLEMLDGRLFLAPIGPNPHKIIDIGTGTGIWAVEMGDLFPGAEVLGLDLSPIQPQWIPPNVRFMIDDVEDEWASGSGWDFAHFRSMALVLRDLQRAVDQTFRHLKPGGYIEFQEPHGVALCDDGTMSETDDVLRQFYDLCTQALGKFGMDLNVVDKVGEYLSRAGFTNITCERRKIPVGTWPRDKTQRLIGLYVRETAEHSLSALSKAFANLGMSVTEREVWSAKVRETLRDNSIHRYYYYYFWYAQKPE
ncbi:S-adenosyl-L-methionine-dependent methyltransferase [Immersiella caudata]|uniref:S-adenosyl-L-methionine-dependent methyltransferase n=1 Tax=Immersiella caudata TaxID=314043 RepID=A0AA39WRC3_9PEZI|nr:S-adenosyl-L-methionine-dependent methyltransferase [Immersiella caudata]